MNIWTYWDKECATPPYIDLCFQSMKKNTGKFKINILNDRNIKEYLPSLRDEVWQIINGKGQNPICHRIDYIKAQLLKIYGGVWLDADTIVLQDISWLGWWVEPDGSFDYVGRFTEDGYISVGIMASRKGGRVITEYANVQDNYLDKSLTIPSGSTFGSKMITPIVKKGEKECCLLSDIVAPLGWKEWQKFFENTNEFNLAIQNAYCVYLYNRLFPDWFKRMSQDEILSKDWLISKIFRMALHEEMV